MSASRVGKVRNRSVPDASVVCRLNERDRELIATVALHGAASRGQLMALGYFSSVSRANRRLRQLFDQKYLRRTQLATGPYTLETIYLLGPCGVHITAELTHLNRLELARQARRQPARSYLEHQIGVVSLRISLLEIRAGSFVRQFLTETECRHEYEIRKGARIVKRLIKPDAFLEIVSKGERHCFFLEFDRGHCSISQMRGVFARYGLYAREGAFQSIYGGGSFEVLVVTTAGERRISHLAAAARDCGITTRFATYDDVGSKSFYGQIWHGHQGGSRRSLLEGQTREGPL